MKPIMLRTLTVLLLSAAALPAALTPEQIEAAIRHGAKYKNQDAYFSKGLKSQRPVDIAATVGLGIKLLYVFGDSEMVSAQSALAHQLMKPFSSADVRLTGNLHALVRIIEPGHPHPSTHAKLGIAQRVNLVLKLDGQLVQPVAHEVLTEDEGPMATGTAKLLFHFDVPTSSRTAVATFIDANGKRTSAKLNLAGVLDAPR